MNIQDVSQPPRYISTFINNNREKLLNIYEEGISKTENGVGILKMVCSEGKNKMDVQFSDEADIINNILQKESWEQVKNSIPEDKKLFIINDEDNDNIFILYI